jgi:hypothetical protein
MSEPMPGIPNQCRYHNDHVPQIDARPVIVDQISTDVEGPHHFRLSIENITYSIVKDTSTSSGP